jgi:tRNA pseudouridine38-40 synthase
LKNYKLTIQYDGTNYAGWQIQKNSITVQQKITEALEILTKTQINLIGSGRTDSGVHSIGQVANFRCETGIDIYKFKHSLNSLLPFDISISSMEEVDENFHARFDAIKRSYLYLIAQHKSPFYKNYSYFYHKKIDLDKLNVLSKGFIGKKDFSAFSKKSEDLDNKDCTIYNAYWRKKGELNYFFIQADRYLRGMVRAITGTLLKAQELNFSESFIEDIFKSKNRAEAYDSVPANGLFLYKVEY